MRIVVIHQTHIVEVSFAMLQHVYPNLIASVPSMLCALARVASGKLSHTKFSRETCLVVSCMLFCRPIESHISVRINPFLMGLPLFSRIFLISLLDTFVWPLDCG